ncbi:MAG: Stp1/IreP family PP2C-type Ser/Thr phosphatase [Bdellovibrionales bacterium]
MKVQAWGKTDKGIKRAANQDSIYLSEALGLFVVADGMGGHKGGEVASKIAVDTVSELVEKWRQKPKQKETPRELIERVFHESCKRIFDKSNENKKLKGMGTTMVLALRVDDYIYIGNVGDSRCYTMEGVHLWQITEDHSLVYEQMRAGIIKPEDIDRVEGKNIITRSVGYEPEVTVDVFERKLKPGAKFLLCSDGLYGMVDNDRINEICLLLDTKEWPDRMIYESNQAGGDDNISIVGLTVSES